MRRTCIFLFLCFLLLSCFTTAYAENEEPNISVVFSKSNVIHGEPFTADYRIDDKSGSYQSITCTVETYASGLVIESETLTLTEAEGQIRLAQKNGEYLKLRFTVLDSSGAAYEVLSKQVNLGRTFFEWVAFILNEYGVLFIRGVGITLLIAVIGTAAGFIIGLLVAILRTIPEPNPYAAFAPVKKAGIRFLSFILSIYIEVFRGTPMMVQAMVIFYGLAGIGIKIPVLAAAIYIVSINTGAYMAEIIRGGIISVDNGQKEAARAIGMSHWQSMILVVLPQAVRNIMPSICNEFVVNIKDSSVLNVISVSELFFVSKSAAGTYLRYFEVFFITGCIYLTLTFTISRLLRLLERKMDGKANYTICGSQTDSKSSIKIVKEAVPND